MRSMKRTYQITGTVMLLFSAFIAIESLALKFYTTLGPGPGFFPFWLSVVMGTLSAAMLYHATFTESPMMPEDFFPTRTGALKALAVIVAIAWVVLTMERLGFRVTMTVFMLWLIVTLGRVRWSITIAVTLAVSFGGYYMFNDKLQVILPVGQLDEWIRVLTYRD